MSYHRYLNRGQNVFLINLSEDRDTSVYHSFTGKVLACDGETVLLKTAYRLYSGDQPSLQPGMRFKLTTEALGMGVQVQAELIELLTPEELKLQLQGTLTVYQRRQSVRINVQLPFLYVPQKSSLAAFQREWRRVVDDLRKPQPPRLKMTDTPLNLSTGGFRIDLQAEPGSLALAVADLQDGRPPLCAVAELVWKKQDAEQALVRSGHRFVEILKEDQERLAELVERISGKAGGGIRHRELIDRMEP